MKFCDKCQVKISGIHKVCPLCQRVLADEENDAEPIFLSYLSTYEEESSKVLKAIKFVFLLVSLISVFINVMLPHDGIWSLIVVVSVIAFWIWLSLALKIKRNILKKFYLLTFSFEIFIVMVDLLTGAHMWSFNYAVPIMITASIIVVSIVSKVFKTSHQERVFYVFLLILSGFCISILMATDIITNNVPSYIMLFVIAFFLCYTIIFERQRLLGELKKRFHI